MMQASRLNISVLMLQQLTNVFHPVHSPRTPRIGCMHNCLVNTSFMFLLIASLATAAQLQEVASFPNQQVTGVGVSQRSGRIFVNFPYWSDDQPLSVAEIVNGQPRAFPDDEWNKYAVERTRGGEPGSPESHFVCVQSVVVDDQDNLWILDPA